MLAFSRSADSRSTLPEALAAMAGEAAALMGATRASIWLHDRRTRELWLVASSEAGVADGTRVAADAPETPAALALTLESPVRLGSSIVAPLRGWRRALGALILEGATSPELTAEQSLELAHDVSHQLSTVIENLQLVEEVVRQHRLLKDSFNSLVDLVIVTDNALRVVQTNDALARCLGRRQEEMFQNGLEMLVGSELAEWVTRSPEPAGPGSSDGPLAAGIARTQTFHGSPLGRTVVVTATPLVSDGRDLVGRVIVARDVTQQVQLEVGARRLAGAARAIRKAGVPRAVRRRRGARDQQSASGRARICRVDAALGQDEPDAPRVAPRDVRGRSGCEDRAQSAGVLRIPQNGPTPAHAGPCPFERDLESPDCADEERHRARSPASR